MGHVRIEPEKDYLVDMYVTHTCASDYNYYYRQRQVVIKHDLIQNQQIIIQGERACPDC